MSMLSNVTEGEKISAGNIALVIIGCVKTGGVARVVELNRDWGRFDVSTSADPTERLTIWSALFGGLFFGMVMLGANQPTLQRTCTLKNVTMAKWSAFLGGFMMGVFTLLSTTVGLVIFAYYTSLGCDPVQSGQISSGNQILPFYIMDVLAYPGLPGLLYSGLFSASLSSLSSSINSMSAVMWKDVLEPHFKHWDEGKKTLLNKVLTLFFGLCCLGSSFVMLFVGGSLISIAASVLGAILGPLLGIFFLAALVPFSNWIGALTGGIISAALNLWMLFGFVASGAQSTTLPAPTYGCAAVDSSNSTVAYPGTDFTTFTGLVNTTQPEPIPAAGGGFLESLYSVSFLLYPVIGTILSMLIGMIVSLLTGYTKTAELDPKLVASYVYCGREEDWENYRAVRTKDNELATRIHATAEPNHWSEKQMLSSM